jgi:hypothetical protein
VPLRPNCGCEKAAKKAAARESQHREHPGGSPLDVIKAALDGAAAHVAAPRVAAVFDAPADIDEDVSSFRDAETEAASDARIAPAPAAAGAAGKGWASLRR